MKRTGGSQYVRPSIESVLINAGIDDGWQTGGWVGAIVRNLSIKLLRRRKTTERALIDRPDVSGKTV